MLNECRKPFLQVQNGRSVNTNKFRLLDFVVIFRYNSIHVLKHFVAGHAGSSSNASNVFPYRVFISNLGRDTPVDLTDFSTGSQNCERRLLSLSCLSVCPSVCKEQFGFHWRDFHENLYLKIFVNSVVEIQF
jgi:hypothetical protein